MIAESILFGQVAYQGLFGDEAIQNRAVALYLDTGYGQFSLLMCQKNQ